MKHVASGLGFARLHSTNLPNIDLRKDKTMELTVRSSRNLNR